MPNLRDIHNAYVAYTAKVLAVNKLYPQNIEGGELYHDYWFTLASERAHEDPELNRCMTEMTGLGYGLMMTLVVAIHYTRTPAIENFMRQNGFLMFAEVFAACFPHGVFSACNKRNFIVRPESWRALITDERFKHDIAKNAFKAVLIDYGKRPRIPHFSGVLYGI
jgi:hypothetical protein